MRRFQNVFSKICIFYGIAPTIWVFLGFSKNVSDEHTYHFFNQFIKSDTSQLANVIFKRK